jgi:hypothetical protein
VLAHPCVVCGREYEVEHRYERERRLCCSLACARRARVLDAEARLREMQRAGEKRCSYCGEVKPLTEFHVVRTTGRPHSWCNGCWRRYYRHYRARQTA